MPNIKDRLRDPSSSGKKHSKENSAMLISMANKYQGLFENANDIIYALDRNGRFIDINRKGEEISGYKRDAWIGKTFKKIVEKEDHKTAIKTFKSVLKGQYPPPYIIRIRDRQGKRIWLEIKSSPLYENGEIVGEQGIARDITEKIEAQDQISKLTVFLDSIIENANVWIDVLDKDGNVILWNKAAENISGFKRREVIGHGKIWKWLYPDPQYQKKILKKAKEIIDKGLSVADFNTKIRTKDGHYKFINWYSRNLLNEKGQPIGSVALGSDMTKRLKAEEALKESEKRYRTLSQHAGEGILVAELKSKKFVYANPKICQMLGYSEKELEEMSVNDIHPKDSLKHVMAEFESQARGDKILAPNLPILRKDGTIVYADFFAQRINMNGVPCNLGFITDNTEKRKFEEERNRLASLAAIGTFSATIAHEIRNPLFSISTISSILEREFQRSPQKKLFKVMKGEIDRLSEFVNDMLFYARPHRIFKRKFDPEKILKDVLTSNLTQVRDKRLRIRFKKSYRGAIRISADPAQIKRLFINLVSNSIDASSRGGSININIKKAKKPLQVMISFHNKGKYIMKRNLESIFGLFYTTKPTGSGLGLATCKKIVEDHVGKIKVKSDRRAGTTFTVQI